MMSDPLEDEIRNLIFCDPLFFEHFLHDSTRLRSVVRRCHESSIYDKQQHQWQFTRTKQEDQMRQSVVRILNTIKLVSDTVINRISGASFVDRTCGGIEADYKLSLLTRPGVVLFNDIHDNYEHWENVRLTVSVMRHTSHLKEAVARLAFDARAVFTHQLHRRHLYALALCGAEATFMRFDRAGILYSMPINIITSSDRFTRAFAELLMMNDEAFGYDTAFKTRMNDNKRLDYYVDLPGTNSIGGSMTSLTTGRRSNSQRFKVVERLCNHGDIVGRATIVVRVRRIKLPAESLELDPYKRTRGQKRKFQEFELEELCDESYVLKLVWRDPAMEPEGEILKQLVGIYGLVQYIWHYDVPKACKCGSTVPLSCAKCIDETAQIDGMLVCKSLANIDKTSTIRGGSQYKYSPIQTKKLEETLEVRERRIYSRILLSSVGKPLWAAQNLQEVLEGVIDAILGCWRLVNLGIIHRDISEGNIMLLPRGQNPRRREWKRQSKKNQECFCRCETRLQEYIERFDRDPTGMLCDFDRYTISCGLPEITSKVQYKGLADCPYTAKTSSSRSRVSNVFQQPKQTKYGADQFKKKEPHDVLMPMVSEVLLPILYSRVVHETLSSQKLDYRVGTVAFMSINVLDVQPGQHYEHTFMDDLESFFWALLYTFTGHLDSDTHKLTSAASWIINNMDDDDECAVQQFKISFLKDCKTRPENVMKLLNEVQNGWASHEAVVSSLIQLGSFFVDHGGHSVPGVAFSEVIDKLVYTLQKVNEVN